MEKAPSIGLEANEQDRVAVRHPARRIRLRTVERGQLVDWLLRQRGNLDGGHIVRIELQRLVTAFLFTLLGLGVRLGGEDDEARRFSTRPQDGDELRSI